MAAQRAGVEWALPPPPCAQSRLDLGCSMAPPPRGPQQRLDAEALAEWWLSTGRPVGPAVQRAEARVLGKLPAQRHALPPQHLGWEQAHGDHPDVALGLELHRIFRHLAEASVGGEVVADGTLPALLVLPEEGDVART